MIATICCGFLQLFIISAEYVHHFSKSSRFKFTNVRPLQHFEQPLFVSMDVAVSLAMAMAAFHS